MWSRWSCCSGGSFLRQRVSFVFSGSHVCVGKVYLFDPLRGFGGECGGRRGGVAFVWKQMKRGVCSTNSVSYPAGGVSSGSCGSGNGNGNDNNNCNNNNNNINNKSKNNNDDEDIGNGTKGSISFREAKRLMRLANVESLKIKLMRLADGKETIPYTDLLAECEKMGVARNAEEATAFAQCLDDAGVVLLFRDKVYLHPDKVVDLVRKVIPLELTAEDDPMKEELKKLQKAKNEIDMLAHIQVRKILWSGLGVGVFTVGLFFRLTFWEYSWDVMEPITYFTTSTGLVVGYAYFLFTSRDPTYQDFMKRLFFSRQRILHKNYNFDVKRFNELQCKYQNPINASAILRNRQGVELDFEDALRKD